MSLSPCTVTQCLYSSYEGLLWVMYILSLNIFEQIYNLSLNKFIIGGSVVKNLPANTGDVDSFHGLGRSPKGGNGNPLQYSCLENLMEGYSPQNHKKSDGTEHATEAVLTNFKVSAKGAEMW